MLEGLKLPVGIVTAIAGASRFRIEVVGEAGHAGTVPMGLRKDALAAAAEMILAVERRAAGATRAGAGRDRGRGRGVSRRPQRRARPGDVRPRHQGPGRRRPAQGDRRSRGRLSPPSPTAAMSGSRSRSSTTSRRSPVTLALVAALEAAVLRAGVTPAPPAQRRRARRAGDRRLVPDRHAVRALQGRHQPQSGRIDHDPRCRRGDRGPARLPAPFPWSRRCPIHGRCGCVTRWRSWPKAMPAAASSSPAGASSSWSRRAAPDYTGCRGLRRLGARRAARA